MSPRGSTPLRGRRVLVTRAEEQATELITRLQELGADVVHVPAIRFDPPPSWDSLDRLLDSPDDFDWVVFTSANGVRFFAERSYEKGLAPRNLLHAKVAAVGKSTADSLRAIGIEPDAVPERFRGTEIMALLPERQDGVCTAIVRALEGREELIRAIREKGGEVHLAIAYQTRGLDRLPDDAREALLEGRIDALTFTSPSTAENILRPLSAKELSIVASRAKFVSIGPTTTVALAGLGVAGSVEAGESTVEGLVEAVMRALA